MNPEFDPAAACRYFTLEDALSFARTAYYAASTAVEPPHGEAWMVEGQPYASASDFADTFVQEIADRVSAVAYGLGLYRHGSEIMGNWWPNKGEKLTECGVSFLRRLLNHLPPSDNHLHNADERGVVNAI